MKDKKINLTGLKVVAAFVILVSSAQANMLTNSGFDDGTLNGWTVNSTSIDESTEHRYNGSYSCKFANPTSAFSGRTYCG